MKFGAAVRHRLGPWEVVAADAYRSRFINLDDLVRTLATVSRPQRILEIGCGEGAVAERLLREMPSSRYVGIDVCEAPGRLFQGDGTRAEFHRISSSEFVSEHAESFDLVLLIDVFHHLASELRAPVLGDAARLTAPGGVLVVKDWERSRSVAHLACYIADRYIGGDPLVRYATVPELMEAITAAAPGSELVCESRVPPRRNNVLLAMRMAP